MVGQTTTLATNKPYSTTHRLVEEEMIQRFSHTHPLYKAYNDTVYVQLVIATLVSQYASTIAPFKIENNGHGAINVLKHQFYGSAHWDREVKVQMYFFLNAKWNSKTAITFHTILEKHRYYFHSLQICGYHLTVDIPSESTLAGHLL